MGIEQQVVSFVIAKRLKELGVKQESYFHWLKIESDTNDFWNIVDSACEKEHTRKRQDSFGCSFCEGEHYSAYTVAELTVLYPKFWTIKWQRGIKNSAGDFFEVMNEETGISYHDRGDSSFADFLGNMLIYLLENKLITL